MKDFIYADNAATTELCHTSLVKMLPYLTYEYGNPSSAHELGRQALETVEEARKEIAGCIGAKSPKEIIFTSGGSESDNQALRTGAIYGSLKRKRHLITTAIEHHAVLNTLADLEEDGCTATYLGVNEDGLVDLRDLDVTVKPNTVMVSVMMVNNEVGTIQPVQEIGAYCRRRNILFHTDAVQAVGHIPINVEEMNIDMMSMSGHKFHGPKGVGALYVREGCPLYSLIHGGGQEYGLRAGTENVAGIVGMAAALRYSTEHMAENTMNVMRLREYVIDEILTNVPKCRLNGDRTRRVPGNVSLCFEGIEGASLILRMDAEGICVSAGSACTTGDLRPSHVLEAMCVPEELISGSLRISLDEGNTMKEAETIVQSVIRNVEALRRMSATWKG